MSRTAAVALTLPRLPPLRTSYPVVGLYRRLTRVTTLAEGSYFGGTAAGQGPNWRV